MAQIRQRTYRELVGLFQSICNDLIPVSFFNWGEVEDMEINESDFPETQYPYVFLNPTSVQIIQGYNSYTINLFVFELCNSDRNSIMEAQDTSLSILQDILSKIKMTKWPAWSDTGVNNIYGTNSIDATFDYPVNAIPIRDFNKNGAAGWQATFTITIKNPLDLQNAPYQ